MTKKDIWMTGQLDFLNQRRTNSEMLYEIDESCISALCTEDIDLDCVALLEQLAQDRRKCKNIIILFITFEVVLPPPLS